MTTMRKVLMAVLVLTLLVGFVDNASATDFDLAKLTDEQVIELTDLLTVELAKRGIEKTASLPQGKYVIGRDIPAGKYVFTHPATEGWFAVVRVTNPGEDKEILSTNVSPGETYFLNLEEGNILESDESFLLTISIGAFFK